MSDLLAASRTASMALRRSITSADADNSGTLTVEELMAVFDRELSAKARAKRAWKTALVLGIVALLLLAANAGLVRGRPGGRQAAATGAGRQPHFLLPERACRGSAAAAAL